MGIWIENFEIKGKRYFKFLYAYTEIWYIKKNVEKHCFVCEADRQYLLASWIFLHVKLCSAFDGIAL